MTRTLARSAEESEAYDTPHADDSYAGNQAHAESPAAESPPAALTVGQQLFAARDARGMSVTDVAKMLKLSAHQVLALEADDWSRLPVTVIRGFVRNYARLLKLDPESMMHQLTALQAPQPPKLDVPEGTRATLPETGKAERRDFAAVFSGLALVAIALLAYFFLPQDFWQSTLSALTSGAQAPIVATDKVESPTAAALPQPASAAPPETSSQPASAQQATASVPGGGLRLSFAQPSWVEIRDRSGEIVFSQLNPAGSQRDIEGQPPFSLVIGNASNVTVEYKGKVVELSQRSKDDVARLSLD